jgi:hypothetical protein
MDQRNCPKHVEFYSKNKFEKFVHLVGFIIRIYHSGMYYDVPLKDWGKFSDRETDSCADVPEPVQHPHRLPFLPHSQPYVSAVPLLRAKLPHFLLVVPIRASASSHPQLRLPVALPPTDGWLAVLFRVLEVPGSNLGQNEFRYFLHFLQKFPAWLLKLADNRFPSCPFHFIIH